MKTKQKIGIFILIILGVYFIYNSYLLCNNMKIIEYNDCGKIISKSADEVIIKYGTKTELYLNIQFEKSGFKSIEVDPTLYFQKSKNDYVCFNLSDRQSQPTLYIIVFGVLGFSLILCMIFYILYEIINFFTI
jgi:hypothetical protein